MAPAARRTIKKILAFFGLGFLILVLTSSYVILKAYDYQPLTVRTNDPDHSYQKYTLFAPVVDDIGLELDTPNTIYLADMNGEVAHRWRVLGSVQLARLRSNGNLLYTTRDYSFQPRAGLREIGPFGDLIWHFKCRADHDFAVLPNDNILVHHIEDKEASAVSSGKARCPILTELTPQKDVVWQWRGEEHVDELTTLLGITFPLSNPEGEHMFDGVFDWAHNNTCSVIQENEAAPKDARFKPGNILFSYCNLNTIGIIDKESGRIVWAWGPGVLDGQHNPRMMKNGHILLFDNGTKRGYSRVIEFNPLSNQIVWEYSDRHSPNPEFHSRYLSGAQPLPNGNVFICQGTYTPKGDTASALYDSVRLRLFGRPTQRSRLFEVNRSHQIVWEMIVTQSAHSYHEVYQATRYSHAYVQPLFDRVKEGDNSETRPLRSLPYMR
ncbi:MAG TPA: aryl-sulfate sulfotransferase [Phycisphaerae bacterium]|nr:aryl-sulfate sulfotransferase [Phycisphaerae bacterium]